MEHFVDAVLGIVKSASDKLSARIEAIEKREPVHGRDGLPGRDGLIGQKGDAGEHGPVGPAGKDADSSDVIALKGEIAALRADLVTLKAVAIDTERYDPVVTSVDPADIEALVSAHVAAAIALVQTPVNGQDGKSLMPEDVAPMIVSEVSKAVAAIPAPADPVGIVGSLIDRAGHLVLTFSNGITKDVGLVVGRDVDPADVVRAIGDEVAKFPRPKDGVDGKDGLGFDDLDVVFPDGRSYLRFVRGEQVKEFPLHTPTDQQVWKPNTRYYKGDGVTWGGSWWIAQDTSENVKPGDGATPWRLAVKKGADGKQGLSGEKGLDGKPGAPGRDGRSY